jgi:hypothetical protein
MPETTPAPATAAPAKPVIATAQPAGSLANPTAPKTLIDGAGLRPTVHDVTPDQPTIHRIVLTRDQVIAMLGEIDGAAPADKAAQRVQAQVDGKGNLTLTVVYEA